MVGEAVAPTSRQGRSLQLAYRARQCGEERCHGVQG